MKKIIIVLLFLILINITTASTIIRTFSSDILKPNQEINITINVTLTNDENYYMIYDHYPTGWSIIDSDSMAILDERPNYIYWYDFDTSKSRVHWYIIKPISKDKPGEYSFYGEYQMQQSYILPIQGDNILKYKTK